MMRDLRALMEGLVLGAVISTGILVVFLLWVRLAVWLLP
jgi:hypothetical protein